MKSILPFITAKKNLRRLPLELMIWTGALLILTFADIEAAWPSLCPIDALGFAWCPGCGLGQAIGLLLQGQFIASWQAHPLAVPALAVLLHRIISLSRQFIYKSISHSPKQIQLWQPFMNYFQK